MLVYDRFSCESRGANAVAGSKMLCYHEDEQDFWDALLVSH